MRNCKITIDTGTTNTRICLWNEEEKLLGRMKKEIGVAQTARDGNNKRLKAAIAQGLWETLDDADLNWADVEWVAASGMITSNVGLYEVPHVAAPAGVAELARLAPEVFLEEVCPIPITFIPGVKNYDTPIAEEDCWQMDIMRGEEVEALAAAESVCSEEGYVIVLPGSHLKLVSMNGDKEIVSCMTTMSGELLALLTKNSILADATERAFLIKENYNRERIRQGALQAEKWGIGKACFSGRIANLFAGWKGQDVANYLLGAVLEGDVKAMQQYLGDKRGRMTAVLSGNDVVIRALEDMLEGKGLFRQILRLDKKRDKPLSAEGIFLVMKERKGN